MKRILFVCTGNTCRSPMAEALARDGLPAVHSGDLRFSSAGTHAPDGETVSPVAAQVMGEIGIDMSGHRSRHLDVSLVDGSDLVVVMTREQMREVLEENPAAASKVILLGSFDGTRPSPDIDDPIGGDREVYEACRDEIRGLVERVISYVIEKYNLE